METFVTDTETLHPAFEIIGDDWQLMEIALLVEHMQVDDEYHGLRHPFDVVVNAHYEADEYERLNPDEPKLNRKRIYKAALLHDTFIHQDLDTTIFPTAEHRSAHIAGYILRELGDSEKEIQEVQADILSTNPFYPDKNPHAVVLVRGDIGNTRQPFPVFFANFVNVYIEQQKKIFREKGIRGIVDPRIARESAIAYLQLYFKRDLSLGPRDKGPSGQCLFVEEANRNFEELRNQGEETLNNIKELLLSKL